MKILVTGSAGFIGSHLCLILQKAGHSVTGLDNLNSYYDIELKYGRLNFQGINRKEIFYNKLIDGNKSIRFIEMDLMDAGNLQALFAKEKFEIVINLAAQAGVRYSITNPKDYIDSNITGFFNVLEACRNFPVKSLIFASSSSVYGNSKKVPFVETDATDNPVSFYAATKKSNEVLAHSYADLFKIPTIGLRFFTVYGPWGRPDMAMFMFTKSILEGTPLKVFNNGELFRDFTYIDDITQGISNIVNYLDKNESLEYELFNIGNSKPVNVLDFIKAIESETGKSAQLDFQPMQNGDVIQTYASTEKLDRFFAYKPSIDINEGIEKFVRWYVGYYQYS
jgi:UDP-glucuronate 4-epimerase